VPPDACAEVELDVFLLFLVPFVPVRWPWVSFVL
jgi:hypothetical protein